MNSETAAAVSRIGFRKWYERQLLSSHAHIVLAFLSAIALIASMEAFRGAGHDGQQVTVLFFVVCALVGAWALRRYAFLLLRAERTATQATCPDCGEYGRFRIVRERGNAQEVDVHCNKCACQWMISGAD